MDDPRDRTIRDHLVIRFKWNTSLRRVFRISYVICSSVKSYALNGTLFFNPSVLFKALGVKMISNGEETR